MVHTATRGVGKLRASEGGGGEGEGDIMADGTVRKCSEEERGAGEGKEENVGCRGNIRKEPCNNRAKERIEGLGERRSILRLLL